MPGLAREVARIRLLFGVEKGSFAIDGAAPDDAPLGKVVGNSAMERGPFVPDRDLPRFPFPADMEPGLGNMAIQEIENRVTLRFG